MNEDFLLEEISVGKFSWKDEVAHRPEHLRSNPNLPIHLREDSIIKVSRRSPSSPSPSGNTVLGPLWISLAVQTVFLSSEDDLFTKFDFLNSIMSGF